MPKNELQLTFTENDTEKDFKSKAYGYVCALLNSNGGTLILNTEMKTDKIVRPIEQTFKEIIKSWGVHKNLKIVDQAPKQITLGVKGIETVCTMNYNLYLPSERQVILIAPHEVSTVKDILNIRRIVDITDTDKGVPTKFVSNCSIGITESKTVQFKNLKSGKSGSTDFATRLENNKFTHYVSAFANASGGRLYYGVRDDGTVEGQQIMDEEKEDLIEKVSQLINNMVWPEEYAEPQRGRHYQWDISFEPVADKEGNPIPSTYVIVIYVAACQGGVFCSEPETYHIVEGEVKRMPFCEWKRKLLYPEKRTEIVAKVPQCAWSSSRLKLACDSEDGELLRLINNGEWNELNKLFKELQNDNVTNVERRLVLLSKRFVLHYRKSEYKEAENCLAEFDRRLVNAKDVMIFEVRRHLIQSALERSRGNHKESYKIARDVLSTVEQLAPSILTVEYYVHFATMLTIIESNSDLKESLESDLKDSSFKEEAIEFYSKAIEHLEEADYVPDSKVDMGQKIYINLAILKLGCSLSGDVVDDLVSEEDIRAAGTSLKRASELEIDYGSPMNGFRSCHHSFAKSSLSYRRSQVEPSVKRRKEFLKNAIREAKEAEERAKRFNFDELSNYAKNHAQVFQNELDKLTRQMN